MDSSSSVVHLERAALRKRQQAELQLAERKMLSFSLKATRMDAVRKKNVSRRTLHQGVEAEGTLAVTAIQ